MSAARATRVVAVYRHPTPYRDPLMDRLAALDGIDLEVVYLAGDFAQTPWERGELRHRHRFVRPWIRFGASGWGAGLHPGVLRSLLRPRPDVCVLAGWGDPTNLMLAVACRILRIPYVLGGESFAFSGLTGLGARARRVVLRFMMRGARAWLPAGSRAVEHFVRHGADREGCFAFPTSPDTRDLARRIDELRASAPGPRAELGLPPDGVVVFVGRLVRDKAPEVLLSAWRTLSPRHPDWRLVVVGEGPLKEELQDLALPSVELRGFVQPGEVLKILAASDLLVLPSRYETWGAVTCEAAAAGLPVVVSENVGSGTDVVGQGGVGAIVPVDDEAALVRAIEDLMSDPQRRREWPGRARQRSIEWGHDLNLRSILRAIRRSGGALGAEAARIADRSASSG